MLKIIIRLVLRFKNKSFPFFRSHLQNNGELTPEQDAFKNLPALRVVLLEGNKLDDLPQDLLNRSHTVNVSIDRQCENIHCNFYKKPRGDCIESAHPICTEAVGIDEDLTALSPFSPHACVLAICRNKKTNRKVKCVVSGALNKTCLPGIVGDNTAIKLAFWTFGLLAVSSNLLVLLTLLCNSQVRRTPLCIFVMNLLLGNILIGTHIVIVTVSDTVTPGSSSECSQARWETKLCVPLFIMKSLGLIVVVLSLVLVSVERLLVVTTKLPRYIDACRAVGYVVESWLFASIATVVLWTKTGNWGYLCSTFASGKSFHYISRGVNLSLVVICLALVCLYVLMLRRTKLKDGKKSIRVEFRNTLRMFLLVLCTFVSWAVPYTVLLFTVPLVFTETTAAQIIAISLSLNACFHTFLYSFDNDHLENLYSALSCRKEALKHHDGKDEKSKEDEKDLELGPLPPKKSLESVSMVEVKTPLGTKTCTRMLPVTELKRGVEPRRGSEVSKAEGAVIITNKSPTNSKHEDAIVLLHSAPSSPATSTRGVRAHDEGISDCGTMSSDTNVTWASCDCAPRASPSSPNGLLQINDGNSTLSSESSSTTPSKSPSTIASLQQSRTRDTLVTIKSNSELTEQLDNRCFSKVSVERCDGSEKAEEGQVLQDEYEPTRRERRMSPVRDILVRVLSPKLRKRPKTLEGVPANVNVESKEASSHQRSKSLLEGKEPGESSSDLNPLRPLSPVCLRQTRKGHNNSKEKRNGVLVFKAGDDGLEIHEDVMSPNASKLAVSAEESVNVVPDRAKPAVRPSDWERLATFLVIKPVAPKSKIKINNKERKKSKQSLPVTDLATRERIRIYENPAISLDSEAASPDHNTVQPLSPTRRLAKLEEGDKLADLPTGLKQKNRVSVASTVSRTSKGSLEWDPTYACAYSDDEVTPPPPPPPPKPIPDLPPTPQPSPGSVRKTEAADHVECVQVRLDPAKRYSLEWDPTGVQMRLSVISQDSLGESKRNAEASPEISKVENV